VAVPPSNVRVPEPPEPDVTVNATVTTSDAPEDDVTVTWLEYAVTFNPAALAVTFTVAVLLPATGVLNVEPVDSHVSPGGVAAEK
jgi:hypothetical protein